MAGERINFDEAGVQPVAGRIDFDETDLKPVKKVGVAESAARTAGAAAIPVVKTVGLALATVGGVIDKLRGGGGAQDAVFEKMDETVKGMKEMYAPKPMEEFSKVGELAGGVASVPIAVLGQGVAPGVNRAAEVLERGGTGGEAAKAGAVSGVVNQALLALPAYAGGKVGAAVESKVGSVLAGGATGAAINVPAGIAGRAAESAALPEGQQYEDLKQAPLDKHALLVDAGMSAALGAVGARGAAKARAKAKAEAPPPFPEDKFTPAETEGEFTAPNGATVTKEAWDTASPKIREGWMEAVEKPAEVKTAETAEHKRLAEIERLKGESKSEVVTKALDDEATRVHKTIETNRAKAQAAADADELRRAAGETTDPELQASLRARADKISPPEKLPVGEVKEGQPEIKAEEPKKLPVGEVKEGQPEIKAEQPAKLPVGEVIEGAPKPEPVEKIPVGETKEFPSGVEHAPTEEKLPVGEAKELYVPPEKKGEPDAKRLQPNDLQPAAGEKAVPEAPPAKAKGKKAKAKAETVEQKDIGLPKIDESFMRAQEREQQRTAEAKAPPSERGIAHARETLEKGRDDGSLDKDGASLALWALDKNPRLAHGLKVSVEAPRADQSRGAYNSAQQIVRLFKGSTNAHTAVHEILHHSERMMPETVQRGIRKEWQRAYESELRGAKGATRAALKDFRRAIAGDAAARDRALKAFSAGILNKEKHYQLFDPSEFWAVNGARILHERFAGRGTWRAEAKRWIKEMIEHVKGAVGLRSDSAVLKALEHALNPEAATGAKVSKRQMVHAEQREAMQTQFDVKELSDPSKLSKERLDSMMEQLGKAHYTDKSISFDEYHTRMASLVDAGIKRQKREDAAAPVKGLSEIHPGFKIIPEGTRIRGDHGLAVKDQMGTVVGQKVLRIGREMHSYPKVKFDGRDDVRTMQPSDIKEVYRPRSANTGLDAHGEPEQLAIGGPTRRALPEETRAQKVERKMVDRFNRVLTLQKEEAPKSETGDIYLADQLYQGRAQHRGDQLEKQFIKPLGKQLEQAKKAGVTMRDADDYLMALHAPERNRVIAARNPKMPDGGSGLTNKQAAGVIASYMPEQKVHLDAIAKTVHDMNRVKLDAMVDDGLIKPEVRNRLNKEYKAYVPLKTLEQEADFHGMGRGYEMRANDISSALGRGSKAGSPIAASVMDASRSIMRGEKARVDKSIWEYSQDKKAQDFVREYDENHPPPEVMSRKIGKDGQVTTVVDTQKVNDLTISLVIDGEAKHVFVPDELLRDQIRKLATVSDPGAFLSAIGRGTSSIGRLLTEYNPAFTLPNAVRDAITVAIRTGAHDNLSTAKVMAGIPSAWKAIVNYKRGANTADAKLYEEFLKTGGKTGAYGIQDVGDTMRKLEAAGAKLGYTEHAGGYARKVKDALGLVAKLVSSGNEVMEYASRFAVYKEARANGYTPKRAASVAKEITVNFNRSGEYGRSLNSVFVFANAALQGLRNTVVYSKSKHVQKGMLGMVLLGAALQGYNEMVGGDNEETGEKNINSQNDAVSDKNATVLAPGSRSGVKIPLPPEYAFLFAIGRRLYRAVSQGDAKREAAGIAGAVLDATLPVRLPDADSGALAVGKALTPTLLSPLVDIWTNSDYFGHPVVPAQHDAKAPAPYFTLSRTSTSDVAKAISEFANTATGGDKVTPGLSQKALGPLVSPEGIEHIVGFLTGGHGQLAMQGKNLAKNISEDKPVDVNKLPIANRFAFEEPKSYTSRRYKELQSEFEYAKDYQKAGEPEKIEPEVARALPEYESAERELRGLFKELRVAGSTGMDREPIQGRIKAVQSRVIRAFNNQPVQ